MACREGVALPSEERMIAHIDAGEVPVTRAQLPSCELVLPERISDRLQLVVRQRLDHDLGQREDLRQAVVERCRGRFAIRDSGECRLVATRTVVVLQIVRSALNPQIQI